MALKFGVNNLGPRLPRRGAAVLTALLLFVVIGERSAADAADVRAPSGTWSLVSSPSVPGVGQGLYGVTAISAVDAWAVGDVYNKTLGDQQTLTQHWDEAQWRTIPSPSLRTYYNHLTGVAGTGSNDVWASVTRSMT